MTDSDIDNMSQKTPQETNGEELPGWAQAVLGAVFMGGAAYILRSEWREINDDVTYVFTKLHRSKDDALLAIENLVKHSRYNGREAVNEAAWAVFKRQYNSKAKTEFSLSQEDIREVLAYGERERANNLR